MNKSKVSVVKSDVYDDKEEYMAIGDGVDLLGGIIIPLGVAIEQNGVSSQLSDNVLQTLFNYGPVMLLAATYVVVAILTEGISSDAAAAIIAPNLPLR